MHAAGQPSAPRRGRHFRHAHWPGYTTHWAVLLSVFAALLMAIVVEVYYADLVPEASLPSAAHIHAFVAACAGFLPAMLCLERLSVGSWRHAFSLTSPWLLLLLDALFVAFDRPRWYISALATLLLSTIAWLSTQQIARRIGLD